MKNAQTYPKSFNTLPLHLLGKTSSQGMQALSPCLSSLHFSTCSPCSSHHRARPKPPSSLLSPRLRACCSLSPTLLHSLLFPANNVHSRAISGCILLQKAVPILSGTYLNETTSVAAVYTNHEENLSLVPHFLR